MNRVSILNIDGNSVLSRAHFLHISPPFPPRAASKQRPDPKEMRRLMLRGEGSSAILRTPDRTSASAPRELRTHHNRCYRAHTHSRSRSRSYNSDRDSNSDSERLLYIQGTGASPFPEEVRLCVGGGVQRTSMSEMWREWYRKNFPGVVFTPRGPAVPLPSSAPRLSLVLRENDIYGEAAPVIDIRDLKPRSRARVEDHAVKLIQQKRISFGSAEGEPKEDRVKVAGNGREIYVPIRVGKKAIWVYMRVPSGFVEEVIAA